MKPRLETRHHEARYKSYVVGLFLSVLTTVIAYLAVVNKLWPAETLIYILLGIAVLQLIVQLVFFLHIGRGSRWKGITFAFAALIVIIVVVGTIWIMNNLDYNMMHMSPDMMLEYMLKHQGI